MLLSMTKIGNAVRPRRHQSNLIRLIIALAAGFVPLFYWFYLGEDQIYWDIFRKPRDLRISFLNSVRWHDEVLIPVMEAWLDVPESSAKTYLPKYRFGMRALINRLELSAAKVEHIPARDFDMLQYDTSLWPDIIVSTTCMLDYAKFNKTFDMLLEQHHTHLFCLFHHADQLEMGDMNIKNYLSPWIRARRVDFLALSPHVAQWAKDKALPQRWTVVADEHYQPPVHHFTPVFNFFPEPGQKNYGVGREAGFAIQGSYHKGRNSASIFPHLQNYIQAAKDRNESTDETNLHLVGFGRHPPVPEDLQNHVIFDEDLSYNEFYTTLMKSDAILTLFNTQQYYTVKASSTVPASLIAGTPLVGNKRLLQSYSYLNESIVWMQKPGEDEMDTLGRVLALSREERQAKKEAVRKHTAGLIAQNRILARKWTAQAVKGFPHGWNR